MAALPSRSDRSDRAALRFKYGLGPATVRDYSNRAHAFLKWLAAQGGNLETVSVAGIDKFLAAKRAEGWRPRSIVNRCKAMRSFFRFAEMRGWCAPNLALAIRIPRVSKMSRVPWGQPGHRISERLIAAQTVRR